jgi:hypothetical protein
MNQILNAICNKLHIIGKLFTIYFISVGLILVKSRVSFYNSFIDKVLIFLIISYLLGSFDCLEPALNSRLLKGMQFAYNKTIISQIPNGSI